MATLRLALLGPPTIAHGGLAPAFSTRKALALLVYLAVEGHRHSRDKLAALFWPDSDRPRGRAMLRYTLTCLRRALNDAAASPHVTVQGDTIGLDYYLVVDIDVQTVERALQAGSSEALEHAAELCRGTFLEGFTLTDAPEFDAWTRLQRESCRQMMERVLDRLSELQSERGQLIEAVSTARRWVALSPSHEEAHRRLITLHFAAGNRDAALLAYEACRAMLANDLHVTPAPETESLAERIRLMDPSAGVGTRKPALPPTGGVPIESPLVGRTDEFVKLVELYRAASEGSAQVVIVRGEPGIGKTRLANEFLAWAASHGADVLEARAFETGGRLPYQPFVDALRPRLNRENAPEDLVSDVWLAELGWLLPELRDRYPDLQIAATDEMAARTRLFESIARLGQSLAERAPVVLLVDDVQWADASSLDVLRYTGRRWIEVGASVLTLLSVRSEALAESPALADWLMGVRRDLVVTEIDLPLLTADATLQLVQGLCGRSSRPPGQQVDHELERLARWLFAETGGQPFYAVEIIRELVDRGVLTVRFGSADQSEIDPRPAITDAAALGSILPPGVREVIRTQLARLEPRARDFLAAAAVLGEAFTFDQVCLVAGLSVEEGLLACDAVLRAHVLRQVESHRAGSGYYVFARRKVRDVVYAEAGEARQQVYRRRAMHALQTTAPAA